MAADHDNPKPRGLSRRALLKRPAEDLAKNWKAVAV